DPHPPRQPRPQPVRGAQGGAEQAESVDRRLGARAAAAAPEARREGALEAHPRDRRLHRRRPRPEPGVEGGRPARPLPARGRWPRPASSRVLQVGALKQRRGQGGGAGTPASRPAAPPDGPYRSPPETGHEPIVATYAAPAFAGRGKTFARVGAATHSPSPQDM